VLTELRVHKAPKEVEHLRRAARMSAKAHVYVMRHIKPGMTELQCEALFKAYAAYFGAARHCAYTCICGTGPNGAILHYGHAGTSLVPHLSRLLFTEALSLVSLCIACHCFFLCLAQATRTAACCARAT
jgi:Xaa-Pro aminopeptidase